MLFQLGGKSNFMPYRTHHPVSEWEMDRSRYNGHHTICQQLRDIYHLTDNLDIRMKCRVAMAMSKAMHEKLKEYKKITEGNINVDI